MRKIVIARFLLYAAAVPSAFFGVVYLTRSFRGGSFAASYHQRLVQGLAYADLPVPIVALYTTLVGVIGSLFLATSASQVVLARGLGTQHPSPAIWWALLALNGVGLSGLILVNLRNGLSSPWWANAIVLAIVGTALALARPQAGDA